MLKKNYLIGNEISSDRVSSEKYYDATEGSTNQEDTKKKRGGGGGGSDQRTTEGETRDRNKETWNDMVDIAKVEGFGAQWLMAYRPV